MPFNKNIYKEIKGKLNEYDYISISKISRDFSVGFPSASEYFEKLIRDGLVSEESSMKGNKVFHPNKACDLCGKQQEELYDLIITKGKDIKYCAHICDDCFNKIKK